MVIAWGSSIIKTAEVLKKTIVSGPHRLLRSEYKSIKELCMHSIPQPLEKKTWEFEISWRRGLGAGRPGGVWSLFRLHSAILGRLVPQ